MIIKLGLTAEAGGSADIITAVYDPAPSSLNDRMILFVTAKFTNTTTTPTFSPNSLAAKTITKLGGQPLGIGDIFGAGHVLLMQYNLANTRWELLNPGKLLTSSTLAQILSNGASTGGIALTSINTSASLMLDNSYINATFGAHNNGWYFDNTEGTIYWSNGTVVGQLNVNVDRTELKHSNRVDLDAPMVVLKQGFLNSLNGDSYLSMLPTYTQLEFNGNRKGSYHFLDDNETYLSWINTLSNVNGKVLINATNTKIEHTNIVEFTAASVTKNGYEVATQNFVDQRVQSNIKIIGDWDATSGSYPLPDESNTTPFITQWGSTMKVGWAFKVGYGQAGVVGGYTYEEGDVVYALIDSPGDISTDWGELDHNLQQANESLRGTAKIVTTAIIEDETTLDDEKIVTPYKFWSKAIPKFKLLANTWNLLQTFTNGIKTTLFVNDDGEFKFTKTVAGTILIWTNGQNLRFSATTGGAPSVEIDKTTGKLKLLDEVAGKILKTDSNKGATALSVSEDSIIKGSFDVSFDGQGGVLSVNANAIKRALAFAGDVTGFSLKGDASGSVEIDMKKNGTSMIGAGNKIDLISQSLHKSFPASLPLSLFCQLQNQLSPMHHQLFALVHCFPPETI